ncbi:hypothetical protein ACQP1W_38595 [Spirillospora sp. CA-255316]
MTASDEIAELERAAQRLLDGRVAAIRELAVARRDRDRLRAELEDAEREYGARYAEAERAGWQESELKELDFADPERRPRGRPRQSGAGGRRKKAAAAQPAPQPEPAPQPVPQPAPAPQHAAPAGPSAQPAPVPSAASWEAERHG